MKITTQQKNCITLARIGDKLAYFNGLPFMDINKSDINLKKKIISSEFKKLNSINLQNWKSSINNSIFLQSCLVIFVNLNNLYLKKLVKLYKKNIISTKFSIKYYINLGLNNIIKKSDKNKEINPNRHTTNYNIIPNDLLKKINEPTDENLQIGIILGLFFAKEKYDESREIISIALAKATHIHPYSYLSVFTLANIISYTMINKNNFIKGVLASNEYLQKKYICKNKLECKFVKDYNKFVNFLIDLKNGLINIKYKKIKNKTALTTLQYAITIYLDSPDNWKLILTNACIQPYTTPNTGAIACCFYGLIHGLKNVHKNMLKY